MHALINSRFVRSAVSLTSLFSAVAALGQANPYRGLWVGEAKLRYVNEVSIPLNAQNFPVAPDPNTPTPTADQANLRLILHVNGAGQVSLLKEVALVTPSNRVVRADNDVALVSDPRLYATLPPQPAVRLASAVFDFGDHKATQLLDAMVEAAATAVTNLVASGGVSDQTTRLATEASARAAAGILTSNIVSKAAVSPAFDRFLQDHFTPDKVDAIAGAPAPLTAAQTVLTNATNLLRASVYRDSRAVAMVLAVVAVGQSAGTTEQKLAAAQNTAAAFADVANQYQRFLAGGRFSDTIVAAAETAARAATNAGASATSIRAAVNGSTAVNDLRTLALQTKIAPYRDTRPTDAVELVVEAVIAAAAGAITQPMPTIAALAEGAGRAASASNVVRYAVATDAPTVDYDAFVQSSEFAGAAALAAEAAARGAVSEKRNNGLYTAGSLKAAATADALNSMRSIYGAAARTIRSELPMVGVFGLGIGDPRFRWDIKQANAAQLGAPALMATNALPANHPTNPFRHRRHPSHAVGFDIERRLRLDFDGQPTNSLQRAGFGVDRISGIYREEVFGLHKPLGPQPDSNPVGLRVEGTFELNRISLVDTLNAQ